MELILNHLQLLPPIIPILEEYKWIFIHCGCTLIPSINSERFYSQEPSPQDAALEDPTDEELLNQEEGDDYFEDEFIEDEQFLGDENFPQMKIDQ